MAFAHRYEGAANPRGTVEDLAAGRAHPLQMQALRDVWPGVFSELQTAVAAEVLGMHERGKPPPHERVRSLDVLLDLGGLLGPGYSVEMAVAFEQARAEQPEAMGSSSASPSVAAGYRTRAQAAAIDRAGA